MRETRSSTGGGDPGVGLVGKPFAIEQRSEKADAPLPGRGAAASTRHTIIARVAGPWRAMRLSRLLRHEQHFERAKDRFRDEGWAHLRALVTVDRAVLEFRHIHATFRDMANYSAERAFGERGESRDRRHAMLNSLGIGATSAAVMGLMLGWNVVTAKADQEKPSIGLGMFCDTGEEISAAVGIHDQDIDKVLSNVNARFGKESCNLLMGVYVTKDVSNTLVVPTGVVQILRVDLIGFRHNGAWLVMSHPMEQYIGVFQKAITA
jgi:hypothetical protein